MPTAAELNQFGSAQLFSAGTDDLSPFWRREGCKGFPLGINAPSHPSGLAWWPSGLKGHHCVFGSTRSGKGVSSIIPALMTYSGSAVVIDPKGENAWITAERRRQMGQRVVILDPWGEVNRRYGSKVGVTEETTRFNPLSVMHPQRSDFAAGITAIADALIMDKSSDPHWSNSSKELVAGLTALILERDPGHGSLGDVRRLISLPGQTLQRIMTLHCRDYPNGIAAAKIAGYTDENLLEDAGDGKKQRGEDSEEFRSVRSTARTQTAFLDDPDLRQSLKTDDPPFDLASLASIPTTLYLVLPVDKLETHGRWLRLIITLAIRELAKLDAPPRPPVWFCLDEFGTIGKLQSVETAFGLLSGLGITISAYLQGLDQLKNFYPDSFETFIGNSAVIQVLNARNPVTSNYISDYLGTKTEMIDRGGYRKEMYSPPIGARKTVDGNTLLEERNVADVNPTSRPVMFADEVRRLSEDQQLVIYPGHFSARVDRLIYYEEPRWSGMYRPNPLYAAPAPSQPANGHRRF